jgi:hypothetical protein
LGQYIVEQELGMGFKADDLHHFNILPAHNHGIFIVAIPLKSEVPYSTNKNLNAAHEGARPKKSIKKNRPLIFCNRTSWCQPNDISNKKSIRLWKKSVTYSKIAVSYPIDFQSTKMDTMS